MNPESILTDLSSRSKGSARISRIGTWVERQKGPDGEEDDGLGVRFEEPPPPKSGDKTPTNVEKYGKGEGGRRTLPAHYRNYLQSVGAFRVLPKATQDALVTTYIACMDGLLPILDGGQLLRDYTACDASIFLIQAVCLVTCKIPEVSGFLRLYEDGPLLDAIPFARSLHTGLEAAMKADLEPDRVTKIQILTLMHLHNDGPGGIEESSLHLSHAIHDAWTAGLHIHTPGRSTKDQASMLWWTIWTLDRINACLGGRPIMIADRDIDIARPPPEGIRCPIITIWIRLGDLLDKIIDFYRPTADANATGWETDFPSWQSILQGVDTETFLDSHMTIIELCYNVLVILSCRNGGLNTASYHRRITAADRIESLLSDPPNHHLAIPPLPLVPYAISLSLTVAYRGLRDHHFRDDPDRAQSALTARCEMLEGLSTYWWTAHGMSQLGRKALKSMQNPVGFRRGEIDGIANAMDAEVTVCKYGPFEGKHKDNEASTAKGELGGNALHLLSDAAAKHATAQTPGGSSSFGITPGTESLPTPNTQDGPVTAATPGLLDFEKLDPSMAWDSQMFSDLDNLFDGFFDLSVPTVTFNPAYGEAEEPSVFGEMPMAQQIDGVQDDIDSPGGVSGGSLQTAFEAGQAPVPIQRQGQGQESGYPEIL